MGLGQARTWLRRGAPLLLLAAALGAYEIVAPALPHDQVVVLKLGSAAPSVTSVEVAWTDPREPGREPAGGARWNFAPGTAPRLLRTTPRLRNGEWDVEIALGRGEGETTRVSRHVTLGASELTVNLEDATR